MSSGQIYEQIIDKHNEIVQLEIEIIKMKERLCIREAFFPCFSFFPILIVLSVIVLIGGGWTIYDVLIVVAIANIVYLKMSLALKEIKFYDDFFHNAFFFFIFSISFSFSVSIPSLSYFLIPIMFLLCLAVGQFKFLDAFIYSKKNVEKKFKSFNDEIKLKELSLENNISDLTLFLPKDKKNIEELFSYIPNDEITKNIESIYDSYFYDDFNPVNNIEIAKQKINILFCKNKKNRKTITV